MRFGSTVWNTCRPALCVSLVAACASGWTLADQSMLPAAPVAPKSNEDCRQYSRAILSFSRAMSDQLRACERRDGGSTSAKGVPTPNCKWQPTQQAYVSCASLQDSVCARDNQLEAELELCYRKVAAATSVESSSNRTTAIRDQVQRDLSAYRRAKAFAESALEKGVVGAIVDHSTSVGASPGSRLRGYVQNAARTANAPFADSQPDLELTRSALDAVAGLVDPVDRNPLAKEIARQSDAAARARIADALNALDGTYRRAEDEAATLPAASAQSATLSTLNPDGADEERIDDAISEALRQSLPANIRQSLSKQKTGSIDRAADDVAADLSRRVQAAGASPTVSSSLPLGVRASRGSQAAPHPGWVQQQKSDSVKAEWK